VYGVAGGFETRLKAVTLQEGLVVSLVLWGRWAFWSTFYFRSILRWTFRDRCT